MQPPGIEHNQSRPVHQTLSRGKKLEAAMGNCLVGGLVGLAAGYAMPVLWLMIYIHFFGKMDAQDGLIVLFTAPLGAIIGAVACLRLRRWWGWGVGAMFGLGPGGLIFVTTGHLIPGALALFACAGGGYLLQQVVRLRQQSAI